jgi:hypothetical protein
MALEISPISQPSFQKTNRLVSSLSWGRDFSFRLGTLTWRNAYSPIDQRLGDERSGLIRLFHARALAIGRF